MNGNSTTTSTTSSTSAATPNGNGAAVRPFRIAIVGGGIGGLTAALFIDHFCREARGSHPHAITIDVYEQANEYREIGSGVGLGFNAATLLHTIPGLGTACNEICGERSKIWFTFVRWDDGRMIGHVDAPVATGMNASIQPLSMARSEFLNVLLRFVRQRDVARLHTRKKLTSVKDLGDQGVQMTFRDGTTADADLVIGSDGIHSEVRKQFITGKALYSGKIAYRGVVPIEKLCKDSWPGKTWSVVWLGRHKHFLVYPISDTRSLNIVAFVSRREDEIPGLRESWIGTCDRREMEADFADCDDTVQQIIRLMPQQTSTWRINDHEPVPQWSFLEGKVALLGDACHATTPHQGAGAGQAVEDGYVVAKAIADWLDTRREKDGSPLREWMELYQRIRLPRAQKVVVTSRQAAELYELERPDLLELSYDEAASRVVELLPTRMKWIWQEDLDGIYEKARQEAGL